MEQNVVEALTKAASTTLADTIQDIVNRNCIIDFGIIKKVVADGIVTVEISAATGPQDIRIITCVLANIASKVATVKISPTVGDKVLVVFPRRYDDDMFDLDKSEVIIDKNISGYDLFAGIAFLFNQSKKDYKNLISVDENGNFEYKIGEKTDVKLNADGTMNITNGTANIEVAKDDSVTINGHLKVTS